MLVYADNPSIRRYEYTKFILKIIEGKLDLRKASAISRSLKCDPSPSSLPPLDFDMRRELIQNLSGDEGYYINASYK